MKKYLVFVVHEHGLTKIHIEAENITRCISVTNSRIKKMELTKARIDGIFEKVFPYYDGVRSADKLV